MLWNIYSLYDNKAELYSNDLILAENKVGLYRLRRNIRDSFIKRELTLDWCREHDVKLIGSFDTVTGEFESFVGEKNTSYSCLSMVNDLVSEEI